MHRRLAGTRWRRRPISSTRSPQCQCARCQRQRFQLLPAEDCPPKPVTGTCVCGCGKWRAWPVEAADENFNITRVFAARFACVGCDTALIRLSVRGSLQLSDTLIALRLPVCAAAEAGTQTGIAIIESEEGLSFAQACVEAGSNVVQVQQPALQTDQLYTVTLQLTLEKE